MNLAYKVKCPNCKKVFYEEELIYDESEMMDRYPYCGEIMPDFGVRIVVDPYDNGCCEFCHNNTNETCCYVGEACNNIAQCDGFHDLS